MAQGNRGTLYPEIATSNTAGPYFAPVANMFDQSAHNFSLDPPSLFNDLTRSASQLRISSTFASIPWATPLNMKFTQRFQEDYPDRFALSPLKQNSLYAPVHTGSNPEDLALSDHEHQVKRPRHQHRSDPTDLVLLENNHLTEHISKRKRKPNLKPRKRRIVEHSSNTNELSNSALMELCRQRGLIARREKQVKNDVPISLKRKAQETSIEDENHLPTRRRKVQISSTSTPQPVAVMEEPDSSELSGLSDIINSDSDEFQPAASRSKCTHVVKGGKKTRRSVRARAQVNYDEDTEILE